MNLEQQISDVLSELTPREARILRLRFGFDGGKSHTFEEIGREFSVTRERIRQIVNKALRRLRHPSRSRRLKVYLSEVSSDYITPCDKLLGAIFGHRIKGD